MQSSKSRVVTVLGIALALVTALHGPRPAEAGDIAGAWVVPDRATVNSCRWLRVHITWDPDNESVVWVDVGPVTPAPGLPPQPLGGLGTIVSNDQVNNRPNPREYAIASTGTAGDMVYTLGPFCGPYNAFDNPAATGYRERPADYPYVLGYLEGPNPGSDTTLPGNGWQHIVTFTAGFLSGTNITIERATAAYETVHDNDDFLEWYTPDNAGTTIDPISVGPVEVIPDSGSGSSTYTFRVRYKTGLYSGLNLRPRWQSSTALPGGGDFLDRSTGQAVWRTGPDNWTNQHNWLYGRTTDTWMDQTGYARQEFNDRGAFDPQVLLIIDGQHWAPHYMIPEDPNDNDYTDGRIYRYTVRPTDYQNFLDNIFLLPFDLPGSDPWDRYAVPIYGRPTANNYVSFTAGKHTYEFWATDDYAPPKNRAWVQVGWPGNDCHTEYIERISPEPRPVDGLRSAVQRSRISLWRQYSNNAAPSIRGISYTPDQMRRFADTSPAAPDPYGYPYESHAPPYDFDSLNVPNVNPVLTAHPFFGLPGREGNISTPLPPDWTTISRNHPSVAGGYIENAIPNHTFIPGSAIGANDNPFAPELGFGPDPATTPAGPWKYTNDDTILPNFFNIWNETAATPFRGGKWTQSTKYTLRINYWHSENRPPVRMQVWIAKVDPNSPPGTTTDADFAPRTMEKYDPADNNYTDGVVYQYQVTPDQLPGGGGAGDYYYFFRASDGTRETRFPDRPDVVQEGGITYPPDPSDSGVPRDAIGQDWYWFRVNQALTLSQQTVNPTVGRAGENFVFRVLYMDPDLAVPNPDATGPAGTARGDRPFVARLYVDLLAKRFTVTAVVSDTELRYASDSGVLPGQDELVGLYLVMQSGVAVRKVYRIVGNNGDQILLATTGELPGQASVDGVAPGDAFYVAQRADMSKENPSDNDYTDGVWYVFNTATNMILPPGRHRYFFEFADDWGSWLYPNRTDIRVEGQYVRYPNAGEFVGPEVVANTAPELRDFRFAPDAVTGPDGVTATPFVFYVSYVDAENDPPAFIRLGIDGTATNPATTLELSPDNPNDTVYTDGAIFKSPPIRLTDGIHWFRAQAGDGKLRYPPGFPTPQALPFKGPIGTVVSVGTDSLRYSLSGALFPDGRLGGVVIETLDPTTGDPTGITFTIQSNAGDTLSFPPNTPLTGVAPGTRFIFDLAPGPNVAPNSPPQLKLPDNDNDTLASPGLEPDQGRQNTNFTYTITYIDNDLFAGVRGNPPEYVRVYIDNVQYDMQPVDPTDTDYTAAGGGAQYQFTITNLVAGVKHTYFFVASDGLDLARSPSAVDSHYNGPLVNEPPDPPKQLVVFDTPNDNGGSLDFNFNASLADGGGADDVTEYHLYRDTKPGPFTGAPVLVIRANKSPSYAGRDTTQKTQLQTGVDYFYTVRSYDGATIDPNGDGIPDTDAQGNLVVPINPDNQSVDSNVEGPVRAVDNVPPQPPTGLVAVNPGLGGTIDLSWNLSPDDGAGNADVKEYRIYRNTTGAPFAGPPLATVPAGQSNYRDQTARDGTDYYYVVRAFDGSNESADSNVAGPVASSDNHGPEIINLLPAPGATDVLRSTNIEFDVRDTGAGVRTDTLVLQVDGATVTPTITGSGTQVHVAYNPPTEFDFLASVSVHVEVSDLAVPPNVTRLDYQFTIAGPPVYSISGTILDRNGVGLANVVVSAGGLTGTTDNTGAYTIQGLAQGTYTVTPKLTDHAFVPESRVTSVPPSAGAVNFIAEPGYDITGQIKRPDNTPLAGVRVTDGQHEAITDNAGRFSILDILRGDYTVVPQLAGFQFTPASLDVTLPGPVPPGNVQVTFIGDVVRYRVRGNIRTATGERLQGVRVEALNSQGQVVAFTETNSSGSYTLTGLAGGRYTIVPTKAGHAFEPPSKDLDIASDKENVDFIAVPVYTYTLQPGTRMVSLPIVPRNLNPAENVPATISVARYDPTLVPPGYVTATRGASVPPQLEMRAGRSFWMRNLGAAVELQVAGDPVDTGIPFTMTVESGWNMCGNMFDAPLPWANLSLTPGQSVRDYGFIYNPQTGSYELVTDIVGIGARSVLPKNEGFWIKSDARGTLTVNPVAATDVKDVTPTLKLAAGDYLVPIVARANGRADTASVAGLVKGGEAIRIDNPPAVSPYVDLYFTDEHGARLACDVRTAAATAQTWDFVVATDMIGAQVVVTLPDLTRVPPNLSLTLVDLAADKRIYARTTPGYVYTADETGLRRFRLEIAPRSTAGLVVSATSARQVGGGLVVTYAINRPASVEIAVMNIAGRTQWTQAASALTSAGIHTARWNLRNVAGARVPPGRYLVRISATAEDGQVVQQTATVEVR